MTSSPELLARQVAVARQVEQMLPPTVELLDALRERAPDDGNSMGLTVTVPAAYVKILVDAFLSSALERQNERLVAQAQRDESVLFSPADVRALATSISHELYGSRADPVDVSIALFRAACGAAVANLPRDKVPTVLTTIAGLIWDAANERGGAAH